MFRTRCEETTKKEKNIYQKYHLLTKNNNNNIKNILPVVLTFFCQLWLITLSSFILINKYNHEIIKPNILTYISEIIAISFISYSSYNQIIITYNYINKNENYSFTWYGIMDFIINIICSILVPIINSLILIYSTDPYSLFWECLLCLFIIQIDDTLPLIDD